MTKTCKGCKETFPLSEEYFAPRGDGYFRTLCRSCNSTYMKTWHENNPRARYKYSLTRHDLTPEQYENKLRGQGNVCAICNKAPAERLSVDHDHKCCPGKFGCKKCVRGLLCSSCNLAIGKLDDDTILLRRAISYLNYYRRLTQ